MNIEVVKIPIDYNFYANIEKCIKHNKPFSITTKGELDEWLLDSLATNVFNDVHLCLNTLDEHKWYTFNDGECSNPIDILNSIIDCFNEGIYVYLQVHILKRVITQKDVFQVLDSTRNWIQTLELKFDGFTDTEIDEYLDLIVNFLNNNKIDIILI